MAKSGTVNFYNGVATTSLRFNSADDAYLTREFDAPSNNKRWTYSTWLKRSKLGAHQAIISSNVDGNNYFDFRFSDADILYVQNRVGGSNLIAHGTTSKFRDISAWYNIVLIYDSDNSTAANRTLVYVNGVKHTLAAVAGDGDASYFNVDGINHNFGASRTADGSGTVWSEFGGYVSEVNFCDGQAYAPTNFGETKNGVWIPKNTSGLTFGNNGFRIRHDQVGVGTASTSTIGADVSGNTNHLTSVNVVASDCAMPDSPENNFAIANSADFRRAYRGQTNAATQGGLKFAAPSTYNSVIQATMPINQVLSNGGGVYWEVRVDSGGAGNNSYAGLLVDNTNNEFTADTGPNTWPKKTMIDYLRGYFYYDGSSSQDYRSVTGVPYVVDDIIGFAVKSDGKFFIHKNGTYFNQLAAGAAQNPATGANPITTLDLAVNHVPAGDGQAAFHFNFGQDSTFAGAISAGGEADANGIGDFAYAVPTGFLALCTANMSEPTIGPNSDTQATDHFNTVLYTANNQQAKTVTGMGLQPDWLWIKGRSYADHHAMFDSNRGVNKFFRTSGNDLEFTDATLVTAFNDDGFVLGTDGYGWVNYGTNTLVAWGWVANAGTATATISESGDNPAAVVQANPTAGFSLITYTGTGDAGTIAHGLGAVPTMMIIKNRDVADAWAVYHGENTAAPATDYLVLNTTAATADAATYWADTAPTSSVFTVHDAHNVNANGEAYVAYVFADVEGYSKMGGYTSNGVVSGTFVNLGFRPAWIMFKQTTSADNSQWFIYDSTRAPLNVIGDVGLAANLAEAEGLSSWGPNTSGAVVDFLSNGFKIRTTASAGFQVNGGKMIYMAFAEQPFKYANAR